MPSTAVPYRADALILMAAIILVVGDLAYFAGALLYDLAVRLTRRRSP